MSLSVNLRHLEKKSLTLSGELSVAELDVVDVRDELLRLTQPLQYELEVEKLDDSLLLRGRLAWPLECECARCLKPFKMDLELADWACLIPLTGEESAPVVSDCVDLTPYLREDILLELPRHPLCRPECRGLAKPPVGDGQKSRASRKEKPSSAWTKLDKLKL